MITLDRSQIMALADVVVDKGGSQLLCSNMDGRVRYASSDACKRLGYDLSDLLTKSVSDYCSTPSDSIWKGHCERTVSNGSDNLFTYHLDCEGNRYPVQIYSVPHLIPETNEQLICSLVVDAQNSKRYQRMLETVEQTQSIGSFDFNLHDQSILVSDNLLRIMDTQDPDSLTPASITDRLSSEEAARWNAGMIGFINGKHRMEDKFTMRTSNEKRSLVRVVLWSSLTDGKVSGITGYYELLDTAREEPMISLKEAQRRHIIRALVHTNGRVTGPSGAEKLLDINGKTLFARMKKLSINRDDYTRK